METDEQLLRNPNIWGRKNSKSTRLIDVKWVFVGMHYVQKKLIRLTSRYFSLFSKI